MFGRRSAQTQIQQVRLADMLTEITKAQLLDAAARPAQGRGHDDAGAGLARQAQQRDMALECARDSRRLLGANGILAEYHSMRHMANLESVYTYEGTHDIHTPDSGPGDYRPAGLLAPDIAVTGDGVGRICGMTTDPGERLELLRGIACDAHGISFV